MATHFSILAWKKESHEQRSLAGYSPWGCKEFDTSEWLSTHTQVALQSWVSFCCYEVNKLYLYRYLLLLGLLFPTPIPIPRIQVTAKKTYRWPTGAWKDTHYNELSEKCRSKLQWGITAHWSEWSSAEMSANSKRWRGLVERVEGKGGPLYSWWECI